MKINATPASLGYRMPAEWHPHRSTWISWPHNRKDWEGKLAAIHWSFVEIVRHLVVGERVSILVQSDGQKARVERMLAYAMVDLDRVDFFEIPTNRSWIRDYGPTFLTASSDAPVGASRMIVDWLFNAWARYPNWQNDDGVPAMIAARLDLDRHEPVWPVDEGERRVVLEGGSVDVNGAGVLLTTEQCHLERVQARNPGLTREELEQIFWAYLGAEDVIWLGGGVVGDDTHGHVDDVARFVATRTVVAAIENDATDANYRPLQENLERLQSATDKQGRKFNVITLPMPRPLYFDGDRLPASYLNFYIGNEVVLVPTFNDPADRVALSTLADLFQDREVIGVHALDLVLGQGTLHCLTQQEPALDARL